MTEDQKSMSLILDVLAASKETPRAWGYLADELRLAGRTCGDVPALLDAMKTAGLVESIRDGLGIIRWKITREGMAAR